MIEYAVVGAGVTGSFTAYYLGLKGIQVTLFDPKGIAGAGSGAAGAFIAPKIGKAGSLKSLVNKAFTFTTHLYCKEFSSLYNASGLLHIPKDPKDALDFTFYKSLCEISTGIPQTTDFLKDQDLARDALFFEKAGLIDPKSICEKVTKDSNIINEAINTIKYQDDHWLLNATFRVKHLVLAVGPYKLFDEPYIDIRPIWGERIEVKSSTHIPYSIHQNISISRSDENAGVVIGATHLQNVLESVLHEEHVSRLLDEAQNLVDLGTIEVRDHRGGSRAGTIDYLPIIGPVVDSTATIERFPQLLNGRKIDPSKYVYYPNLSIINGVGGRGFVLGPFLAFSLVEYLTEKKEIGSDILCSRLFSRWVKRQKG